MTDFEKILEVTRMARTYGDYMRETRVGDVIGGLIFIAGGLVTMSNHLTRIAGLFPNTSRRALVMKWYHTVHEMRSTCV